MSLSTFTTEDPHGICLTHQARPVSRFHSRDHALVQQVIAGHEPAQRELFERLQGVVRASVGRLCQAQLNDDDVVQAFYVMLVERDYRVLRSYQGRAALTTWSYPIAKRFVLRQVEQLRRQPLAEDPDVEDERTVDRTPEDGVISDAESRRLRAAMTRLSPDERLLLALLYEQEVPVKAVAKVFGISSAGVRMWHMRLRRKLRTQMEVA